MKTLIDMGTMSWHVTGQLLGDWKYTDDLYDSGALFCFDDQQGSIRKDNIKFYKATRELVTHTQSEMRRVARAWAREAFQRYKKQSVGVTGLEADDLLALHYEYGDTVCTSDKDALQLPGVKLIDCYGTPWGFERVQRKIASFNVSTPLRWLTYQAVYGDSTDGIPRLLPSFDRKTGVWIMTRDKPFRAALGLMPPQRFIDNLNCAVLPTPLYLDLDPVMYVIKRYTDDF